MRQINVSSMGALAGRLTGRALALAAVSSLALAPALAAASARAPEAGAPEASTMIAADQASADIDQNSWPHHHKKPRHHGGNGVWLLLGALAIGGGAAAAASGGSSSAPAPTKTPLNGTDYSDSITLGGTVGQASGAVDTALHGDTVPLTYTQDTSKAGFTESVTFTTPGGSVVASAGGANSVGQFPSGVIAGTYSITSSTDAGIATSGSGQYQIFDNALGLQYASFGLWQLSNCSASASCLPLYVGAIGGAQPGVSLTATMPALTGYAAYWGEAAGYLQQPHGTNTNNLAEFFGTLGLSANLTTGNIIGGITGGQAFTLLSGGSQTLIGSVNDITLSGTISGNTYTATATASSTAAGVAPTGFNIAGSTGSLIGGFYGPNAEETAGTFYLSGGTNGTALVGSLGAGRNTNVLTSTQFSISGAITDTGGDIALALAPVGTITNSYTNDYSPATFTKFITQTTQGGNLVLMEGGANTYNPSATLFGQTNVATGSLGIVNSAVAGITTSDGGSWQLFGNAVGLTYANFGVWEVSPCANTATCTPAYVGVSAGARAGNVETTTANMPTTGTASFSGGATGFIQQSSGTNANNFDQFYGTATLTANFTNAGGTITGGITGISAYSSGPIRANLGTVNDITFTGTTISGAEYTGSATVTGGAGTAFDITGAAGSVKGAFYGTSGPVETAGVFSLTGGANGTNLTGSFGAIKVTAPSDSRLKQEITPAGSLPNGLRLYSWRYLGGRHRFTGVMAQELLADARFADAVERDGDGLMRVDYGMIGYSPADLTAMRAEGEAAVALYRRRMH